MSGAKEPLGVSCSLAPRLEGVFGIPAHLQKRQQEITVGCRAPNCLLKADTMNVFRNGTDEYEVPVSFTVHNS